MRTHTDARLDLLLRHAAGGLDAGFSLLVESHLSLSASSSLLHAQFEALGGALLEEMTPADVDPAALNRALCAIEREPRDNETAKRRMPRHPKMPEGFELPEPLAEAWIDEWRWIAPGVRSARVILSERAVSRVFLLEMAPGLCVPRHGHDGDEATCVLRGGFSDGDAHFGAGDIAHADEHDEHSIVIDSDMPCLCLIAMEGCTRPHSWLGRLYQKFRDI